MPYRFMPAAFPNDLSDTLPGGASTPTNRLSEPRMDTKRRQTMMSLLDILGQLAQESDLNGRPNQQPSFEDDRDVPTVDEHLQVVGAESFNRFQKRINNLDKELRNFANAARQLGSSVGILSSAFHLRERLAQILFLFRENAADLFPRKVVRQPRAENLIDPNQSRQRPARRYKPPPNVARPIVDESLDPENFPEQLESLAVDVTTFLYCLNEFPEFTDEAVNASIISFEGDLKYWASCLKEYRGQFRYPAVQRYIHDLTSEMVEHIDSITSTLSMFIEIGVPTIRFAQKHGATNLLNLSTVATFFSAVTATTLQFSYNIDHSPIADAVNCFWFASLVFSIGAAVNSLLGLTWKQAMYRSPGHRVPWWVLIWIKRSPLVFLVMSVASFSIGLCCFAYASNQNPVTSTITTVFTAFTSFGLAAVSTWFASERWIFLRHRGKKWLGDVLIESKDQFLALPGMELLRHIFSWNACQLRRMFRLFKSLCSKIINLTGCYARDLDSESDDLENGLPFTNSPNLIPGHIKRPSDAQSVSVLTTEPNSPSIPYSPSSPDSLLEKQGPVHSESPSSPGKQLWQNALRSVKMRSAVSSPFGTRVPHRQRTTSSTLNNNGDRRKASEEPVTTVLRSRVAALVPKLKGLENTQDLAAHAALVRHLQFSPNGKFLATSSWDKTSVIFRVGDPFTSHRILAHARGFVGQVAWSPNGNLLLTKLNRGIKVWTEDGVCKKTIDRRKAVESMTWFPGGEAFMSVEGSDVTKLDLNGNILDSYNFGRMKLHDVAVTPDGLRLLGVGPLLESPTGLQPSRSRVEKRLVVYNMSTKQIENQTPVLNDVRDITLARKGLVALISYENKAPPQLWRLELVKDRENSAITTARLTLRHTYMPKVPVDFAGPSYFGGKNDELVLCAGKAGDIHIWDQESGALLHQFKAQALGGDLTCISWNSAADNPFMFATGSHDGAVRIWTQPTEDKMKLGNEEIRIQVGNESPAPRSPSPFEVEMDRTDSPITQQDFEASLHAQESSLENGSTLRERVVAFADGPSGNQ